MYDQTGRPMGAADTGERIWAIAALVLAVLVLAVGWPLLLRSGTGLQLDYDEGWNAARAQSAAHWLPLYAAPPGLDITNYPPLSFHIIGLLSRLTGDATMTGRFLSLVALAALVLLVRAITRQFTAARHAGACAALLFMLWMALWMPNRIGVNDPQLLGMVFEVLGLYAAVSGRKAWTSAPLFALALFTKHNLVAMPFGVGLSLLVDRRWRRLVAWLAAGALAVMALYLATLAADGPYFLVNLLQPRAYKLADALSQSSTYLLIFLPFILLAGVWVYRNRHDARRRPLVWSWLAAHALAIFFSGGDGAARNMFFEAILLDAVIAVIAGCDYLARNPALTLGRALLLCLLPMLFPLSQLPGRMASGMAEWRQLPQAQTAFVGGVDLLRGVPGPALCENLLMCERAGKSSAFDPYYMLDQIRLGKIEAQDITVMAVTQRFGAVEIGSTDAP
ncbi:MAG: glycosyltransferase family 39 protein, partial [Acidocella sp.]|nr:glycosyltransferase family 39 protein [Acidocella sp.]